MALEILSMLQLSDNFTSKERRKQKPGGRFRRKTHKRSRRMPKPHLPEESLHGRHGVSVGRRRRGRRRVEDWKAPGGGSGSGSGAPATLLLLRAKGLAHPLLPPPLLLAHVCRRRSRPTGRWTGRRRTLLPRRRPRTTWTGSTDPIQASAVRVSAPVPSSFRNFVTETDRACQCCQIVFVKMGKKIAEKRKNVPV